MYKEVDTFCVLVMDKKTVVLVSNKYHGSPFIGYQYDILLGSKGIISKYRKELIPEFHTNLGWQPVVKYI